MTKHRDLTLFLLVASFALHTPLLAQEDAWQRSLEQGKTALDDYEYETAENHLLAALETASELSDPDLKIAATLDELGRLYSARGGKYGQAEPSFRRALEIRKAAYGPNHLEVAGSHARLAEMLFKGDKDAEAEQHFRRALEIRQDLLGETHPDVARSWTRIGLAQWYQGKFDEAEASCQRALELQEQSLGPNDLGLVEYVETLGDFYLLNRKEQEALAQFRRGVEIREQVWGPDDPRFVAALRERGGYYSDSDLDDEAIRVLERALSIQEKLHGSDSNEVAQVLGELATACRWSEQADRTENLYLRAIRIRERFDPPTLDLAAHLVSLAELYRAEERYAEAAKLCERGLSIRSAHLQPNDRRVTALLKELGELHSFTENWPQAESYYQRLLAIQQKDDPNSYGAGMTLVALGDAYLAQQKNAEAAEALTVALASIEEEWGKDSQQVLEVHLKLADAYTQLGQPADAQRHQQRAGEIQMTLLWTELSAGLKESWGQVTGDVPSWVIGAVALIVLLMLAFVATVGYLAARLTRHLLQQHEPPPGAPVPPPDSSLDPTPSAVTEPEPPAEARVVAPLPAVLESGPVSYPAEASPPLPALGSDLSATPSTPLPAPLETRRFAFHGEGGSLFGIHIVNVLLTLLTLGIYYFWGKVKVRRYLYSQAEFDGDRFAFHGTGKELFFGWLKIVPALAFLIWFPIILMMVWDSPLAASVGQFPWGSSRWWARSFCCCPWRRSARFATGQAAHLGGGFGFPFAARRLPTGASTCEDFCLRCSRLESIRPSGT